MNSNTQNTIAIDDVIQQLQAGSSMPEELLEIFAEEAEDHLRTVYDGLSRLSAKNDDMAALADVRRASHTLKGAAGAVNLLSVTRLAHRMEDLLDRLAERNESVTEKNLKLMLTTADQIQELTAGEIDVNAVAQRMVELYQGYADEMGEPEVSIPVELPNPPSPAVEISNPTQSSASQTGESSSPSTQYLRVPLNRLDDLVGLLGEMVVNRSEFQQRLDDFESRIEDMHSAMERLRNVAQHVENQNKLPLANVQAGKTSSDQSDSVYEQYRQNFRSPFSQNVAKESHLYEFDQLEFEQYDDVSLLSQKLAEADKDAEIMSSEFRSVKSMFDSLLRRQQQLNRDAQQSLMKIRMVPLSGIVSRLERTVRTVGSKLGKQVRLEMVGDNMELDKTILDTITDPILHLIRNSIGHGVESATVRAEAGKPETARLCITAVNHGTQITLKISDDGAGINLEKVRQKAFQQGLIKEDQELSRDELHGLIFLPGFSTATELTDVSGRGVGMDVVGDAIRRLKGTIRVESNAGIGTTFTIQLPTTLGVARAVIVESNGQAFAVPMPAIKQIHRLNPDSVTGDGEISRSAVGNRNVRLIDLSRHLHIGNEAADSFKQTAPMLILGDDEEEVGVTVDSIVGCQDIVVKTLGDHLNKVRGIIGATIGGDGSVIPILDTSYLINRNAGDLLAYSGLQVPSSLPVKRNLAMVIDDSISVRRVTENLLEFAGWNVVTAKDGVDALETLAGLDTPPDVFLCDMEMPRMDGLELIRQIREQAEFELTPVVMVTSRASEKHRHKAFEAGATEYVVKPYHDEQLMGLITRLVESARETVSVG